MRVALDEAVRAARAQEVPVGAVLVVDGHEIARGHNRTLTDVDPCAHAEVVCLRAAAHRVGDHRVGGTLYVTLEPCVMCMGALVQARIDHLVFGALDPKAGAAESLYRLGADERLNHRFSSEGGLCGDEAGALLTAFFRARRA
jgi:tRNA(adenine34) deaminase